jgi:hypothetical protein
MSCSKNVDESIEETKVDERKVDESIEETKVDEIKGEDLSRLSPKRKRSSWKKAMMTPLPRKRTKKRSRSRKSEAKGGRSGRLH